MKSNLAIAATQLICKDSSHESQTPDDFAGVEFVQRGTQTGWEGIDCGTAATDMRMDCWSRQQVDRLE